MNAINLLQELKNYPVFTENDVAKIVNKQADYVKTMLYRLYKKKYIQRIEKGKYTLYDDPFYVASHITTPSYIGLWTALRYYNMTQQQPQQIFVMVAKPKAELVFQGTKISFVSTKHMFGYRKVYYQGNFIFVADKEKTIVDAMLYKLPLEDVKEALQDKELDKDKLICYALQTKNQSLVKRMCYLLEQLTKQSINVTVSDKNYIPLDYHQKKQGAIDKKWRLLINLSDAA